MKILLISMQSESAIGGVEKYNSNLINMFNKNFIKYDLLNFSDSSSKFVNNKNKKYFMLFKKIYIEFNKKNSIIKKSLYLFYIKNIQEK